MCPSYRLIAKPLPHGPNFSRPSPDLVDGDEHYEIESIITPISFAPHSTISSTGLVILLQMTSGSPLPNLLMLPTLSPLSTLRHPSAHPRPPPVPPHDVRGRRRLKGGATFYFLSSLFPRKYYHLNLSSTLHSYLPPSPPLTYTPCLTPSTPLSPSPSSPPPLSPPQVHLHQSLTLTMPQEPITAPVSVPSSRVQPNPVTEYTTHTEDYINRIRTFHVPTYALDGVRESLQRGDGIAFLAQSEASLQRFWTSAAQTTTPSPL